MNFYTLQYQNGDCCPYQSNRPLTKNIQWDSNYYPAINSDNEKALLTRDEREEARLERNKKNNIIRKKKLTKLKLSTKLN